MENDVLYNRIMNVIHEEYGEGSTAVANPEGEPTDDLTSIQIGDEIYGISGGGGSNEPLIIEITGDAPERVASCTFTEFQTAYLAGKRIIQLYHEEGYPDAYNDLYVVDMELDSQDIYTVKVASYNAVLQEWSVIGFSGETLNVPMTEENK